VPHCFLSLCSRTRVFILTLVCVQASSISPPHTIPSFRGSSARSSTTCRNIQTPSTLASRRVRPLLRGIPPRSSACGSRLVTHSPLHATVPLATLPLCLLGQKFLLTRYSLGQPNRIGHLASHIHDNVCRYPSILDQRASPTARGSTSMVDSLVAYVRGAGMLEGVA
jgi:hypothetical protein